ncbi:hypothetical protein CDAR_498791 [Caerostris darwini]|uniref:Uncharacterized protein n=1 Tax=Caerostris darwini TaxID=1538125 RepID=A0AAV4SK68_9ARAC|nr:hypothetical protein CDAR_498791 [Caerostris darwini]
MLAASSCSDLFIHPAPPPPSASRGSKEEGKDSASRDRPPIALATVNRIKIYRHRRCASQRKQFALSRLRRDGGLTVSLSPSLPS